jgi:5-(carboxyamino)imidazole ribonucleotide mutase
MSKPLVGILMGSKSDLPVMEHASLILSELGIENEMQVLSAHRHAEDVMDYARTAADRGLKVLIAGAGMAAALPGVVSAGTLLPVLGVPLAGSSLQGMDALLSIVQMPKGIPVGTLAIGKSGAINAGLLAAQIIAINDAQLTQKLANYRKASADAARA